MNSSSIQTEHLKISYRELGKGDSNLVLIHGLASNQHIWDLAAPLLAESFHIYTYDQRGHGTSEKPNSGYDFSTVTQDLHAFLQLLKIQNPILVGHSWGGNVALNYASKYPDLIRGVCLVDGGFIEISRTPGNSLEKALIQMAPPDFTNFTRHDFISRIQLRDWGEQDETSRTANLTDIVLSNFDIHSNDQITPKFKRSSHLQVIKAFWEHKPSKLFEKIQCPVLYLPARMPDNDPHRSLIREQMIDLATISLKTFKTIWFENSIHDLPIQKPERLSKTILTEVTNSFFD